MKFLGTSTLVVVLLIILLLLVKRSHGQQGVCRQSHATYSVKWATRRNGYLVYDSYRCGAFGWSRCRRQWTQYRQQWYTYSGVSYSYTVSCCNGYTGNPPDCKAVCQNGCHNGECINPGSCSCRTGWTGDTCFEAICSKECQNNGICVSPNKCACAEGWQGLDCTEAVCQNGCHNGECINPGDCSCTAGWIGDTCLEAICSKGCKNNGTCVSPNKCACAEGWQGLDCTEAVCQKGCHNGECINPDNCSCRAGWTGDTCSEAYCAQGCYNNGTCILPNVCSCVEGWSGTTCANDTNECLESPCKQSQKCINTFGSYKCDCYSGYEFDSYSQECKDINECNGSHECSQNCHNQLGWYSCSCRKGFLLKLDFKQCEDINECFNNNAGCHHKCVNTPGSYECTCSKGYELLLDEHSCKDIAECINGLHNCTQRCIELEGGYICACDEGYELDKDGVSCKDVDECTLGISRCHQVCRNTIGSYQCDCDSGYQLHADSFTCEDINECTIENGGCSQVCNNTPGNYRCSCDDGYQLQYDGISCIGQQCLHLMKPINGNYSCNGLIITGTTCSFQCDQGYRLFGSMQRTCLSSGKWSGNTTLCEILHCAQLNNTDNGTVILPCSTELNTACRINCLPDFYMVSPNSSQQCLLKSDSVAAWSEPPVCIEKQGCTPNPCKHGGLCSYSGSNTISCSCDQKRYTGEICNTLVIDVPDIPTMVVNSPITISISAWPDKAFTLNIESDRAMQIMPSSVMFSDVLTRRDILVMAKDQGLHKLEFTIDDNTIDYKPIPPAIVLATKNQGCSRRKANMLKPGCCQATEAELGLKLECPNSDDNVVFNSTCGWATNDAPYSGGVIFSSSNGFNMPISVTGAKLQSKEGHIDLDSTDFQDICTKCNTSITAGLFQTCNTKYTKVKDVQCYLHFDSLAFTYLQTTMSLLPKWIRIKTLQSNHNHDLHSYMVKLVYPESFSKMEECHFISSTSEGLHSVLIYTGSLEVEVDKQTRQIQSNISPVCFAVNLCEGANAPLYFTIPDHAKNAVESYGFMQDLKYKGYSAEIRSVVISNSKINSFASHTMQQSYWNGLAFVLSKQPTPQMVADVKFSKVIFSRSAIADFTFSGYMYISHDNFDQMFNPRRKLSWFISLIGLMKFKVTVQQYGEVSFTNDTNPSLFLSANTDTCHGCSNPLGFTLKLTYHMDSSSTDLFATLLFVPPKEQFGLRTQFSCPLEAFVFMDDDHDMEAMSIVSQCLGLRLGSFPIFGLESHLYMFDRCRASPFCSVLEYSDTFIVWSTFPQHVQSVSLGSYIKLLPVSNSDRTALYATFSKNAYSLQAKVFNIQLSLFEVDFSCTATIDDQQLHFEKVVQLFGLYSAKLNGNVKQTNDWKNAPININGLFLSNSNNIPDILCKLIERYVDILYNRSSSKVRNAEIVYNRTASQYSIAQLSYHDREAARNESGDLVKKTEIELLIIEDTVQSLTNKLQMLNNNFQSIINRTCMIKECPEICIPQQICESCQQNVTTSIQGSCLVPCKKDEVSQSTVGYKNLTVQKTESERRCPSTTSCTVFECSTSTTCTEEQVSKPVLQNHTIIDTKVETKNTTCNKPCAEVYSSVLLQTQCCGKVGCNQTKQDIACLQENQQCQHRRNTLYMNLNSTQHKQVRNFELLDRARANRTVTNLRLMRYKARHNLNERQYNVSKVALEERETAFAIASRAYQLVKQQNPLDLLHKIRSVQVCGFSPLAYIEIKTVALNATVITESPAILELDITVSIHPHHEVKTEIAYVDFQHLNTSLWDAAVDITDNVLRHRSKRHYRNTANTVLENANYFHFQRRCTGVNNILSYVKELNSSIYSIAATAISSKSDLDENINEILNLIDTFSINDNVNSSSPITNFTMSNESAISASIPDVIDEAIKLIEEHLSNNQYIEDTFDVDLFKSWQAKMEILHNTTKSAAGLSCLSFSDCLQVVADTVEDLVNSVPVIDSRVLATARRDLLDLALLQNYSIISALANTEKMIEIASDPVLYHYWCADPPKITIHPSQRIAIRENTTVELRCEVEIEDYSIYQWNKNSVQIPHQKNNTLVLTNIKLSDSGIYTCVVTNQVSSATSANVTVEVQQFPSFLLQPNNVDVYLRNRNGATFKSNATGFPPPAYRWYFQQKGSPEFTLISGENWNELTIATPLLENEGSYYCEAFSEQGVLRSRIVNLTVLESTVVQVAQTIHLSFIKLLNQSDINSDTLNLGSGETDTDNEEHMKITLTPTEIFMLQEEVISVLHTLISFGSTSLGNITIYSTSATTISIELTLYSENISYPDTSLNQLNFLAPQARVEWLSVWESLQETLGISELFIANGEEEYKSNPLSLQFGTLQLVCPPGKNISPVNNLLCVSCLPGSYQVLVKEKAVNDDGSVIRYIVPKCTHCPVGQYQEFQGQSICMNCPLGYTTLTTGARFKDSCVKQCSLGEFSRTGVEPCEVCPTGTYSAKNGSTSCFNCSNENSPFSCPTNRTDHCKQCQHFCYDNSTCGCNEGYTLSSDKYRCIRCADVSATYFNNGKFEPRATWHVTICNKNDQTFPRVCSGNLINDQWIVTSAKCACGVKTNKDTLSLRLKKSHTCAVQESGELNLAVSEVYCHPDHNSSSAKLVDLALIRAKSHIPVHKLNNTFPLCLENSGHNDIYQYGIPNNFVTFGLGNSDSVAKDNVTLSFSRVSLLPLSTCLQQFSAETVNFARNPAIFCMYFNEESNCAANTGSAIIVNGEQGKLIFAGIASSFSGECGLQRSFIANMKIQDTKVLKWVRSIIAEKP